MTAIQTARTASSAITQRIETRLPLQQIHRRRHIVHAKVLGQRRILPTAVTNPPVAVRCTWQSFSKPRGQAPPRNAMPKCSSHTRPSEVVRENPSSPFSVSSRFGARPGMRGLLYCSAKHSQETDGFRGLSDLLGSVGDDSKSESGHIHFSILLR